MLNGKIEHSQKCTKCGKKIRDWTKAVDFPGRKMHKSCWKRENESILLQSQLKSMMKKIKKGEI